LVALFLPAACGAPLPRETTSTAHSAPTDTPSVPAPSATPAAPKPAASVPKADFATRMGAAICEASAPCCKPTGAILDPSTCSRYVVESWAEHLSQSEAYDGQAAARCLEDLRPLAARCAAAPLDVLRLASCSSIFRDASKLKKTGEPCERDAGCASSDGGKAFCWQGSKGDQPGRCALETRAGISKPCFAPSGPSKPDQLEFSQCDEDPALRCSAKSATCVSRAAEGEVCEGHGDCAGSAVCHSGVCKTMTGKPCTESRQCGKKERCADGKCAPGGRIGEACGSILDCAEGLCAASTRKCSSWAGAFLCSASK
jgi:hypothetical protein